MDGYIYSKDDLNSILRGLITSGERWPGYDKTVQVADFWNKIISGKGHDEILISMRPGEKKDQKDQKVRLYNSRTKSVANKIQSQIKEVYRSDNIFNSIHFSDKKDDNSDRVKTIKESLTGFSGRKSVRRWLRDRFLRLNMVDPNSYIVVSFTQSKDKKQNYYPIEVRSKDVLKPYYLNGTLQYLAFKETGSEKVKKGDNEISNIESYKYWIFGHDWAILYHKCPKGANGIGAPVQITQASQENYSEEVEYSWYYSEYNIKARHVPAYCVGYVPDPENNDQTFQSIMYPSEELQKELIWKKSMYDVHSILHGIAQKFAFVPSCDYDDKDAKLACTRGILTNGKQCPQCNGTGQMPFHTSEQDIITLTLPKKSEDIWDLSKMIWYQPIPVTIIENVRDEVKELERAIPLSIFNTSLIDRGDLWQPETATKVLQDTNSTNNVLFDFGLADAEMYKNIVTTIAVYSNQWREDLVIDYSYPNDFNLETTADLFAQAKEAIGSPIAVRNKVNSKLIAKLCIDDKEAIADYETRQYWRPFTDQSQLGLVPEYDRSRILYIYFDQIFRELENNEYKANNDDQDEVIAFSSLPKDKQKEEINKLIDIYLVQYKEAKSQEPDIRIPRPA